MKRVIMGLAVLVVALGALVGLAQKAWTAEAGWSTSLEEAKAAAKKSGRPILIDFTGSDWCGWCIRLKNEVFSTPEFGKWAAGNVVLLEADFPQSKPLPPAVKAQNAALAEKYAVKGYPTIVFIEADGKEIGRTGYLAGGPGNWLAKANELLETRAKAGAAGAAGDAKPGSTSAAAGASAGPGGQGSLAAGITQACEQKKPLLLIQSPKGSQPGKAADTLLAYGEFRKQVAGRVVTVNLKGPPAADSPEASALAELLKTVKVPPAAVLLVLLDLDQNKVLYRSPTIGDPGDLVKAMAKVLPVPQYDGSWLEDFQQAKLLAATLKRPMLLDFTGSDWCGWCIKLDQEIFGTAAFKEFAAGCLILVKVDFPRKRTLSAELKQQNDQLAQKYGIQGYPTLVMVSSDGAKQLGETFGYMEGGPQPFIQKVKATAGMK